MNAKQRKWYFANKGNQKSGIPEEVLNRLKSNMEPQTGTRRHDIILKKDAMEKFRIKDPRTPSIHPQHGIILKKDAMEKFRVEPEKEFTIGGHVGIKNGLPDVGGEVKFTIRKF